MCGIFGITSNQNISSTLVDGLQRLEYRGYDSCGVAVYDGETLTCRKGAGEVAVVRREERFEELSGTSGLGHTRWATHGRVSRVNSHPHLDSFQEVAIVHNGIIENHEEIRQGLIAAGHSFLSETDSEVVAHLIEAEIKKGLAVEEAILGAVRQLHGTFGIGVITMHSPGVMYAVRRESPLILGIGDGFHCFASDPLAFSEMTDEVVYMQDGEMVIIDKDSYRIRSVEDGSKIERESTILKLDGTRADHTGFPDFMSKEIQENGTVTRTALSIPDETIDSVVKAFQENDRNYLTGMGTAFYVALMGQYLFARYAGRFFPAVSADELPYVVRFQKGHHVLAVSQSGETYDTLKALRDAQSKGASTSAVLNVPSSSMARETDRFIDQQAGSEICVLSTKCTLSQLVILARVALRLGELDGFLPAEKVAERQKELQMLPELLDQVWNRPHDKIRDLARRLAVIRNWFFLGRRLYCGLAMEAALKFKEVTYSHAEGMSAGFLKHGTISLIDEAMHTAIFLPGTDEPELRTQTLGAAAEINARGGVMVAFQPEGIGDSEGLFADVIEYPACGELAHPFLGLMNAQLFAYYTARALGRNVDKPRALAKSVTVG